MSDERPEILLIEDNDADAELTMRVFRRNFPACQVTIVRDGAQALDFLLGQGDYAKRANADPPRLMLLDLKMPRIDGLEFLKMVKSDPRTRAVPVVAITSSREERDIAASYRLGVSGYVVKPVDSDEFNEAIRDLARYWLMTTQLPGPSAPSDRED